MDNGNPLIRKISKLTGVSYNDAKAVYDMLFFEISNRLINGEKTRIYNFCIFDIAKSAERQGYDPNTRGMCTIPAHERPVIRYSKNFREEFNKARGYDIEE